MPTKIIENTKNKTSISSMIKFNFVKLWCVKDRKVVEDVFRVLHKYNNYYVLQGKGFRFCVLKSEICSNSMDDPVYIY